MDTESLVDKLETSREAIRALSVAVPAEQAHWKPSAGRWSILEVINHLYDEEREDFRVRLDITLRQPGATWPPIDPEGWVRERSYQRRDLLQSLQRFLSEREQSVQWLRSLSDPQWQMAHYHPRLGNLSAGDILAAWVAHDLLHLRQLTRLHYDFTGKLAKPFSARYAGGW